MRHETKSRKRPRAKGDRREARLARSAREAKSERAAIKCFSVWIVPPRGGTGSSWIGWPAAASRGTVKSPVTATQRAANAQLVVVLRQEAKADR
jgi:hypothetical protein